MIRLRGVALLAEGVDRNILTGCDIVWLASESPSSRRAWIEMPAPEMDVLQFSESPSSRRAWIEIDYLAVLCEMVAKSPSSRRAWIEMLQSVHFVHGNYVALLAEGVDRNPCRF